MTEEPVINKPESQKLWHIILIAVIAIIFTTGWLISYELLFEGIWNNDLVKNNHILIPAGVLFFSFLVGLCLKYLRAPDVINGSITDALKGEEAKSDYTTFPGTLLSSFFSLFSGASVGPEGSIAVLIMEISAWARQKLKVANENALGFDVAALASAYNGIIGNPLFTAILATEFNVGNKNALKFIAWNLIAGSIGFLFFSLLGLASFASLTAFPPIENVNAAYILYAVILGVAGSFFALFLGLAMRGIGEIIERTFKNRVMARIMTSGAIIAIIGYFVPSLLFSGESSIQSVIANPAQFGFAMLIFLGIMKLLLLALSFKSGYLGGPIFPVLFACTAIGMALSLIFPGIPVGILVLCFEVAVITLALGVPLAAILLIASVGSVNMPMLTLLVISAAVALLMNLAFQELRAGKEERSQTIPKTGNDSMKL